MKATKIFMMAALALTFAACSNNDDIDLAQQPIEQPANGEITITATLEANDGASTRALSIDGSNIASTWKTTDQFAILYNNGTEDTKSIATVDKIDGTTVTITFTIPASLASNTPCTIVYPASAAKADNTGADVATALAAQDGTIGNCPEVRVGTATIDKTNHSLSSVSKLAAQNAIFKFTLKDIAGTSDKAATEFIVSNASGDVMTTVTSGSASGELYVALPVMAAGTYWFNAIIDSKPYIAKATTAATTVAGKYYQTTVKMATIGDVILADGTFAARLSTTGTKVAMIAYVGSETGVASYTHGLALALSDEATKMKWTTATGASGAAAHTPAAPTPMTSSWMLPSRDQWTKMIDACKNVLGTKNNYMDLRDGFSGITDASNNLQSGDYWSSTEGDSGYARGYDFKNGIGFSIDKEYVCNVRACLAF